jgi:hypothetical protein
MATLPLPSARLCGTIHHKFATLLIHGRKRIEDLIACRRIAAPDALKVLYPAPLPPWRVSTNRSLAARTGDHDRVELMHLKNDLHCKPNSDLISIFIGKLHLHLNAY